MKKTTILLTFFVALLLVPAAFAVPNLDVDLIKYEPVPAQPGQYVSAYIQVENTGDDDAQNAVLQIEDQFPFTTVRDSEAIQNIGLLKAKQTYIFKVDLLIASTAPVGETTLQVKVSQNAGQVAWKEFPVSFTIKPTVASLSVTDVQLTPQTLLPGQEATLKVNVQNTANITLRNIAVQLGMVGMDGEDLPFIPSTVTQKRISRLEPGAYTSFDFSLRSYPQASPGYYKLPLVTSFYDDAGSQTQQEDVVGVIIAAQPKVKLYLEESSVPKVGEKGTINLKFVNKGINNMKFLDVQLQETSALTPLSTTKRYIGDLSSDDYRSENFDVQINEENATIAVDVTYMDENNNEFNTTLYVEHTCCSSQNDGDNGPSVATILLILVVLGWAGRYWYKKRQAKKTTRKS